MPEEEENGEEVDPVPTIDASLARIADSVEALRSDLRILARAQNLVEALEGRPSRWTFFWRHLVRRGRTWWRPTTDDLVYREMERTARAADEDEGP